MKHYQSLIKQTELLLANESHLPANMSNFSALVFNEVADLNWAGFYMWSPKERCLLLESFQGKPACTRIASGKGVCGTAYATQTTQNITDVHHFKGHIACDSASNSELVIPLVYKGQCWGVFDMDSPIHNRFSPIDQTGIEHMVEIFCKLCLKYRPYPHNQENPT